jgi:putative transposase
MGKDTVVRLQEPEHEQDPLSTMLREGAQRLIAEALQVEFEEFLLQFVGRRDELGRAAVVRMSRGIQISPVVGIEFSPPPV